MKLVSSCCVTLPVVMFSIWGLWSIGGNADEVKISTISTTQCPANIDIHSSTDIFRDGNTGEGGERGGTYINTAY